MRGVELVVLGDLLSDVRVEERGVAVVMRESLAQVDEAVKALRRREDTVRVPSLFGVQVRELRGRASSRPLLSDLCMDSYAPGLVRRCLRAWRVASGVGERRAMSARKRRRRTAPRPARTVDELVSKASEAETRSPAAEDAVGSDQPGRPRS